MTVFYEKGALSLVEKGYIGLSKTNIRIKTNVPKERIRFVRVVPKGNHINIEVGYCQEIVEEKPKEGRFASIDFGLNNLMTVSSNVMDPFIVNGRPVKSINQFYNKEKSKFDVLNLSKKDKQRFDFLSLKRENKLNDYVHKSTRLLVNHLVSNNIDTLIVGRSVGWKQDINIGKKNNQNFVNVPFYKILNQLIYKCRLVGISVEVVDEAYTSKCSFFDNEDIAKHGKYLGRRVKRGLFKTADGRFVNADLNGSLNILKKYLQLKEAWNNQIWLDLVDVCSTQNIRIVSVPYC